LPGSVPVICEFNRVAEFFITLLVDALLGTGSKGAPRGRVAEAIRAMNASGKPIVAVDLPSGLDADTGAVAGEIVHARDTVTFIAPKVGMFLYPGAESVGRLHVTPIGFPWETLNQPGEMRYLYRPGGDPRMGVAPKRELPEIARGPVHPRPAETNKGDHGHVGVVAGSRGMVGAPAMLARAAQRVGCGLVSVLSPESAQPIIATKLDEQMTIPLAEIDGAACPASAEAILEFAKRATVFCMGPGMTTHPGTVELIQSLIRDVALPLILDADGLNALTKAPECVEHRKEMTDAPLVITPHPGEAARLLGTSIPEVQSNRLSAVRELARRYNAIAILKGSRTLVTGPEGPIWINGTGNPGMATGGMGDALTGVLGGLFAQWAAARRHGAAGSEIAPEELAALGVYIHGLAGDLAADGFFAGLTAGDLIEHLPKAVHIMEESC
jgi:NAD(P)H-hydrate epimerase